MFKKRNPSQLQAQLAQLSGKSNFGDADRNEWKLKTDNAGNGQAVIRFLPGKDEDSLPFIKLINHGFRKNGKWYINNCTSTHGDFDSCPVCQYMNAHDLYNSNKTEYQQLKRKISYWANILVLKDPACPENEGKVMKMRFGAKIMEKINAMINVDPELGETPVDVTCVFTGANFVYKAKKVGEYINYDDSKFMTPSELPKINDPAFQQFLMDSMEDLNALVAPDKFNSFEENNKKFLQVMGTAATAGAAVGTAAAAINDQLSSMSMSGFDEDLSAFDAKTSSNDTPPFDMGSDLTMSTDEDAALNALLDGL